MKILITDDSMVSRMILKKLLLPVGAEIIEASNGTEALNAIEASKPDLVLLDLLMPDINGMEVLEILHKKENSIPVIILTADIQESTRLKAIKMGAAVFIYKPATQDKFLEIINKYLE